MNRTLEVCSVGWVLASALLFAQDGEWKRLMQRGEALEHSANYRQAAACYLDAAKIARGREVVASLNSLGLAYEQMGRFSEAAHVARSGEPVVFRRIHRLGGRVRADLQQSRMP